MQKPATAAGIEPAGNGSGAQTPVSQFVIPASASLEELGPRTLKHGDTFVVFDRNGDVLAAPGSAEGLYHRDTRHLSHFLLTLGGVRPLLLSSTLRDDNAALTCDLTNPDLTAAGRPAIEHDLIHIRRSRFLWQGAAFERLAIRNFDQRGHRIRLSVQFGADFADLFEVRGNRRSRRGVIHPAEISADCAMLSYTGLDEVRRQTRIRFDPQPSRLAAGEALYDLDLAPGELRLTFIEIRCDGRRLEASGRRGFLLALRDSRRALRSSTSKAAFIATSNEIFNEAIRRSVSDLYMLVTHTPQGPYPYAGIPWFSAAFGRDALITAMQTLWLDPSVARGVLRFLAANQATERNPAADAEPGKILHELRYGEMAELGEVPFRRYYGSVDSTPLFVMLAGAYLERTGDMETIRALWPHIEAALTWIGTEGDRDGDGFVEYSRNTREGLANQGWKDSGDSVFHADGTLATGPIALVEVQAYVFGAWKAAARISDCMGRPETANGYEERARVLAQRFDEAFFDEELGTYVPALDGVKRPCRVRTSNAGHALFTGIARPERAASVVRTLMASSSFCGWGIRTVAAGEARYNPMSYHNGSVWPHDNAMIAAGLARYGYRRQAARIFEGLFAASCYIDLRRLPELFCGFGRRRGQGPTFYPVACSPQAWSATAPLSLLQSCIGLGFDPGASRISLDRPALPDFLDKVAIRGLAVNGGKVDLELERAGAQVTVNVTHRVGDLRVVTTN